MRLHTHSLVAKLNWKVEEEPGNETTHTHTHTHSHTHTLTHTLTHTHARMDAHTHTRIIKTRKPDFNSSVVINVDNGKHS